MGTRKGWDDTLGSTKPGGKRLYLPHRQFARRSSEVSCPGPPDHVPRHAKHSDIGHKKKLALRHHCGDPQIAWYHEALHWMEFRRSKGLVQRLMAKLSRQDSAKQQ